MEGDKPQGYTEDQACRREQPAEETGDRPNQNGRQNVARAARRGEASRAGEQHSRRSPAGYLVWHIVYDNFISRCSGA